MSDVRISALASAAPTRGDKVLGMKDGAARQFGAGPSFEQLGDPGGSALVGHTARGAGAVARSVQARLGDTVCVFDFMTAEQIADVQACTRLLDVTASIQAAIDWAMYRGAAGGPAIGSIHMPSGVYKTTDTIHLGYGNKFNSVQLLGDGMRYRSEAGFSGTAIVATFNDRPAIAVSGARATKVRDLTIVGRNQEWILANNLGAFVVPPKINDRAAASWVDPAFPASASSRYAPYCGIAIDPYAGAAPAVAYPPVAYPRWTGIAAQYGKNYSSDILLENVEISGFVVGVALQPSDADGNGDYLRIKGSSLACCQYGLSIGNSQSREIVIESTNISQCFSGVVTTRHGRRVGKPQIRFQSCDVSYCISILDVPNTSYGTGLHLSNVYCEGTYSIGVAGTGGAGVSPVQFTSCEFDFGGWKFRGVPRSVFSNAGGTTFTSCSFSGTTPAGSAPNVIAFHTPAELTRFDNCLVFAGTDAKNYHEKFPANATAGIIVARAFANLSSFTVRNIGRWNLNTGAATGPANLGETGESTRNTCLSIYHKRVLAGPAFDLHGVGLNSHPHTINKAVAASISTVGRLTTVNLAGSTSEAQLHQGGGDVGDVIVDGETGTVFFVKARNGLTLTLVAQNNYDAHGELLAKPTLAGAFYAQNCRRYTLPYPTFGNTTASSATVTSFARGDGHAAYLDDANTGLQTGDWIASIQAGDGMFNVASADGAGISAINTRASTITFKSILNHTQARRRFDIFIRPGPANDT